MNAHKKTRFSTKPLVKLREPHAFHFLSERVTFWIAIVSVIAFVVGNMVGQHGLYTFFHLVVATQDPSAIAYTEPVNPVAKVPDYKRWAQFGGDPWQHTFRQVPSDLLRDLPKYYPLDAHQDSDTIYSTHHLGSYTTEKDQQGHEYEKEGSHDGVDIRVPQETPVVSALNGVVAKVGDEPSGFGKYVIVQSTAPDPADPSKNTTLSAIYAHLSAVLVSEGNIVKAGELIANSGKTGNASGPHLHFGMFRSVCLDGTKVVGTYWPFTSADMRAAGLTFMQAINQGLGRERAKLCSIDPMLYVQAKYPPVAVASASPTVLADARVHTPPRRRVVTRVERIAQRLSKRQSAARLALADPLLDQRAPAPSTATVSIAPVTAAGLSSTSSDQSSSASSASHSAEPVTLSKNVASIEVRVLKETERSKTLEIFFRDDNNNPARPELDIYLRTGFGKATFRPGVLSPSVDIDDRGRAVVEMNHETPTVVLELKSSDMQMHLLSDPITSGAR